MKHDSNFPIEVEGTIIDRDELRDSVRLKVGDHPAFWISKSQIEVKDEGKTFLIPYGLAFKHRLI